MAASTSGAGRMRSLNMAKNNRQNPAAMVAGMIQAGILRTGRGSLWPRDSEPREEDEFTEMGIGEKTGPVCGCENPPCAHGDRLI
jgi:hypothetical protein